MDIGELAIIPTLSVIMVLVCNEVVDSYLSGRCVKKMIEDMEQ